MIDYRGKAALVTGSASGIGKALAEALVRRGAHVVLADKAEEPLEAVRHQLGAPAAAIVCDLAHPNAPGALVSQAFNINGRLDLICSNAGVGRNRRLTKETLDDDVDRLFAVNLFAALRLLQAYLKNLEPSSGRGRMMLTASENSLSAPAAVRRSALGLYAASKHGLLIMAEWLRSELAEAPVDLHVLLPGAVYTPMVARAIPDPAKAPPELGLIMPERCAELALKGMDVGLFYIPTHAHLIDDMRPRFDAVSHAIDVLGLREAQP